MRAGRPTRHFLCIHRFVIVASYKHWAQLILIKIRLGPDPSADFELVDRSVAQWRDRRNFCRLAESPSPSFSEI